MALAVVTLSDIQKVIGLEQTAADDRMTRIGESAEAWVAEKCGVAWTSVARIDYLNGDDQKLLHVENGPVTALTSVYDRDLTLTLDSDEYRISADGMRIQRMLSDSTYSRWERGMERWKVSYTGGYDGAANVPSVLKEAILQLCRRWWDVNGGKVSESSEGLSVVWAGLADSAIMELLWPYVDRSSGALAL